MHFFGDTSRLRNYSLPTSLTAWFFVLAASQRTRQHLRRRRIFAKSAGVAKKVARGHGVTSGLCNTRSDLCVQLLKVAFL